MNHPMIHFTGWKHLFYLELAKLLGAGFGIREAAAVMKDTRLSAFQVDLLNRMERGLEEGLTITEAFSGNHGMVSAMDREIIRAGEKGGRLAPAFQHLADYYGLLERVKKHLIRGLVYPLVILHLGVVVSALPPALMGGEGNLAGKLVLNFALLYAVLGVVFLMGRSLLAAGRTSSPIDHFLNRIPFLGKARLDMALARFTRVHHIGLLAGMSMSECVGMAAVAAGRGGINMAGRKLQATAIEGNKLGPVFLASPEFPTAFSRSYATGEASGNLDKDLARWSEVFQQQAEASSRTLAFVFPKIIYALVVMYVAWKILGFWSGYYETLDHLGE